jgi:hypothetical protein
MRPLRLALAGAVILALLSGLGGPVVAQDDYSRSGMWSTSTDEQNCWNGSPTGYIEQPSGDYQVRGIPVGCDFTSSDPRLSGTWTWDLNEDCFADGGCVNWGTVEGVGPDGTWSGWYTGTERPDSMTHMYRVLVGAGDYEGLTRIEHSVGPFAGLPETHGVTYEGEPPPMLDMEPMPAE